MIRSGLIIPQINTVGLVAHYKLWAGLTTTGSVFDYSLNGNGGTVAGTDIAPAYPGFTFNGTDDMITLGNIGTIKTCGFWLKPANVTQEIMQFDGGIYIDVAAGTLNDNGGGLVLTFYVNGVLGTTIAANVWNFVACTEAGVASADVRLGQAFGVGLYTGLFGDAMFYDIELSAADIKSVFELSRWRYQV